MRYQQSVCIESTRQKGINPSLMPAELARVPVITPKFISMPPLPCAPAPSFFLKMGGPFFSVFVTINGRPGTRGDAVASALRTKEVGQLFYCRSNYMDSLRSFLSLVLPSLPPPSFIIYVYVSLSKIKKEKKPTLGAQLVAMRQRRRALIHHTY